MWTECPTDNSEFQNRKNEYGMEVRHIMFQVRSCMANVQMFSQQTKPVHNSAFCPCVFGRSLAGAGCRVVQ